MLPVSFPLIPEGAWLEMLGIYGPPFAGSGPWSVALRPFEDETGFHNIFVNPRNESYEFDVPWFTCMPFGEWVDVVIHEKFSEHGWVEAWLDGEQEHFFNSEHTYYNPLLEPETTKLEMATMDGANDGGPNSVRIGQYRRAEAFEPSPTYFEYVKIGETRKSVGA